MMKKIAAIGIMIIIDKNNNDNRVGLVVVVLYDQLKHTYIWIVFLVLFFNCNLTLLLLLVCDSSSLSLCKPLFRQTRRIDNDDNNNY